TVYPQKKEKSKNENEPTANGKPKSSTKSYADLITKDASTDAGVFTIHNVSDKYYYTIPDSLLTRDFLWISRIANIPAGLGGGYVNAGTKIHEKVITWEKRGKKIVLKTKSYNAHAADSLPIYL